MFFYVIHVWFSNRVTDGMKNTIFKTKDVIKKCDNKLEKKDEVEKNGMEKMALYLQQGVVKRS